MTKILLVEDDKSLREIYGVRLLAEGYDIISAGDGEDALALAIKDRPALIVSDVMMPKISGFDMLDILRSTTETRDIKVIMMTALSSEDQRKRGEDLGADRYLVKSQVGIEDVVRTVHEVLGDTPAAPNTAAPAAAPAPTPQPVNAQPRTDSTPAQQPPAAPPPIPNLGAPMAPPAQPTEQQNPLPQPTAPFSTQRPAGLGDRIIQPIERPEDPLSMPISDQMAQELEQHQTFASPQQEAPTALSAPAQGTQQQAATPDPSTTAAPVPEPDATEQPSPMAPPAAPDPGSLPPVAPAPQPATNTVPQNQLDAANADEASLAATLNFEPSASSSGDTTPPPPPPPPMPDLQAESTSTPEPTEQPVNSAPEQEEPAPEQQPPAPAA